MRKFERQDAPQFLEENWDTWGKQWEARRQANAAAVFHWHQHENEPVNQKLLPILKKQTQEHCSFCDNFPISPPSNDTIEHFRPKSKFPREAYRWSNLYYCCNHCQLTKTADFDENALQPDDKEFSFSDYFYWDFTTGELKIRADIAPDKMLRAEATIKLYGLNIGHPRYRLRALLHRSGLKNLPLDDFPYRGFLE